MPENEVSFITVAKYRYTYDAVGNILTKKEPLFDDFNDGNYTGWTVLNGTWSASGNALLKTDNGWGNVAVLSDDADNEIRFDYRFTDISGSDMGQVVPRYLSGNDNLAILIAPGAIILYSTVSGTATTLDYQTFGTTEDQWYTLRIESDGANVKVWRSTEGELETEVLTSSSAAPTTTDAVLMGIVNTTMSNSPFEMDNIRILADDLDNDYTFTCNTANELTSMTGPNGTTTFTYDYWGRQTAKTLNGVTDSYGYRYGGKLYSVDLATNSSVDVTFNYGGDQKRRIATVSGVTNGYKWDAGWNIINEEDNSGSLTRSYSHTSQWPMHCILSQVDGNNPSTGSYNYLLHDHLGSTRALYDQNKAPISTLSFTPYGSEYLSLNKFSTFYQFGGYRLDSEISTYYLPIRIYDVQQGRWTTRDPFGLVDGANLYRYAPSNPINYVDSSGAVAIVDDIVIGCVAIGTGVLLLYEAIYHPMGEALNDVYNNIEIDLSIPITNNRPWMRPPSQRAQPTTTPKPQDPPLRWHPPLLPPPPSDDCMKNCIGNGFSPWFCLVLCWPYDPTSCGAF